ncbi:MAG TPA: RluA family pseudouridine synthase [Oligoflexia bacterium]|nr:RluA family pseudouridine synthase [Oligoflexia bacterium]
MERHGLGQALTAEGSPQRIESFLALHVAGLTRRQARIMCEQGCILLNGKKARSGTIVRAGDQVIITEKIWQPEACPELAASQRGWSKEQVLYEDDDLLVVFKPRAMPSMRLRRDDPLTLADCIAHYCPACLHASPDAREAGLVQRLDYFTTGAVLIAKTRTIWNALYAQLLNALIDKKYYALIEGKPAEAEFTVSLALVQLSGVRKMKAIQSASADRYNKVFQAETRVKLLGQLRLSGALVSLVELNCTRVRRHQIRVHLAAVGHPLAGDQQYGSQYSSCGLSGVEAGFFLHAAEIAFKHPVTGNQMLVTAPSPELEEIQRAINDR